MTLTSCWRSVVQTRNVSVTCYVTSSFFRYPRNSTSNDFPSLGDSTLLLESEHFENLHAHTADSIVIGGRLLSGHTSSGMQFTTEHAIWRVKFTFLLVKDCFDSNSRSSQRESRTKNKERPPIRILRVKSQSNIPSTHLYPPWISIWTISLQSMLTSYSLLHNRCQWTL